MSDDLAPILKHYPAIARPFASPEPLGNAGGLSGATLWRFNAASGPLVLRRWPENGPGRDELARIHRWQASAGRSGFVPVPIATLEGSTFVSHRGRLWELAPWLAGSPASETPGDPARLRAAFAGLGVFHSHLAPEGVEGPSPGLLARLAELDRLASGELDDLRRAIARGGPDACRAPALAWIDLAGRLAGAWRKEIARRAGRPLPLQPCLRDARPEHFLLAGDRLTGLVDFGAMGIESVAADLGRLLSEWDGLDPALRASALDAYARVRPLGDREAGSIAAFERSAALLGPARWVRWHFLERRRFDDPDAARTRLERGLARLRTLA